MKILIDTTISKWKCFMFKITMNFLIIVNSFTGKLTPRVDNNIREKDIYLQSR